MFLVEKTVSPPPPPKKGICVVHSSVFPLVSFWPFLGLLLFDFLFLCLSLVIFFLPSFLFLISVSGSCFFLFSLSFQAVLQFLMVFFCLLSCFGLNHNLRFVLALHLVLLLLLFFVFVAFISRYFLIFGNLSKHSENMEIPKTSK